MFTVRLAVKPLAPAAAKGLNLTLLKLSLLPNDGGDLLYVVTADQRRSRRSADRVPAALDALGSTPVLLGFERTAGDEIQGAPADAPAVVDVVTALVRADDWRIGIGIGSAEEPLPDSTRAARGPVYVAARAAVEQARTTPAQIAVVGVDTYASSPEARLAESALWLLGGLLRRRTAQGWEVVDLLAQGHSQREIAGLLGVTESAVSQRVTRSGWAEQERAVELAVAHLAAADHLVPRDERGPR